MTSLPDDVPDFQLYSSKQAAILIRGSEEPDPDGISITKATLDGLASSGKVECTMIGRKRGWTLAQIAAAVAYCRTSRGKQAAAAATASASRTPPAPELQRRGDIAPLVSRPGSRYATSTR